MQHTPAPLLLQPSSMHLINETHATKEGVEVCIHERGYRDHPLTEEQKEKNREKSRVRARIEHIFGFITISMRGIFVRSVGMLRAKFNIGMINLVYNMFRAKVLLKNCPLARVG